MRKVIVNEFMSLDGVAQAPGGADEDPSGGFAHGGWHMRYMEDEQAQQWVLEGIVAAALSALKQESGGDLHVIGSTELVRTLVESDLVDEFRLMIDPVLLGGGKRIFRDDGLHRSLRLVDGQVTRAGAILATYAPAA